VRTERAPRRSAAAGRVGIVLFLAAFLLPFSAAAQTTGKIVGTVTDESGALLDGVQLELAGPKLQGRRSTSTSESGRSRPRRARHRSATFRRPTSDSSSSRRSPPRESAADAAAATIAPTARWPGARWPSSSPRRWVWTGRT